MKPDSQPEEFGPRHRVFPVLLLLTLAFLLPLLAGWGKLFFDDIAFIFYPQQVFLARCLGDGIIPWWNPHLCAGATPFYAHPFQASLSPANWLFLWTGLLHPAHSYLWLIKMPLAITYLLSAAFSYLFSRRGLELDRAGSAVFAVAYTFSPFMIYFSTCPPEVYVQAWLPLLCLCLVRFARTGCWGWLALGAVIWAFVSGAGDVPVVFQVVLLAALFATGVLVISLGERNWRTAGRTVLGGAIIFGVGFLLAGIYWSNMLAGLRMLGADTGGIVEELSGRSQSLHPLYLITLAIPDYFGGVTSHHAWGAAFLMELTLNDVNLLGGLAAGFLVFLGFFASPAGGEDGVIYAAWSRWWWLFGALFIFGIFVVVSAYTPVHGLARKVIPILRMPYPVRFRSIECFALAGLLGVSTSLLLRFPAKNKLRRLVIYAGFVVILSGLVLIFPYRVPGSPVQAGWRHLAALRDWAWFLSGPVLYLVVMIVLLAFMTIFRRGRFLRPLLVIVTVLEILFFAYRGFYFNRILNFRNRDIYALRYAGPSAQPEYRKILSWRPEEEGEKGLFRRLYFRSYFDNLAWLDGSLSMFGFDIKPLDRRFQNIVEKLTTGFPYEIKIRRWDSRFWPNMSVRYLLAEKPLRSDRPELQGRVGGWYAYADPTALPRVFVLDRIAGCSEAEAREELVNGDLHRGVFVEESNQLSVISNQLGEEGDRLSVISDQGSGPGGQTDYRSLVTDYRSFDPGSEEEYLSHFERLQAANPITRLDFSNPNRVEVEVEMNRPAMLVMTDVWHPGWSASLDGERVPLLRVNYLQRGVWCGPGRHRVEMEFRPPPLNRGIIMTGAGLLGLIVLVAVSSRYLKHYEKQQ
jgi:hypothetical protein